MSEPKLYGIERADGTLVDGASPSLWLDRNPVALKAGARDGERIVEVALVKKDRLRALESLVRAADRMREESTMLCYGLVPKEAVMRSINAYDTQRAAVGEIGEE